MMTYGCGMPRSILLAYTLAAVFVIVAVVDLVVRPMHYERTLVVAVVIAVAAAVYARRGAATRS